MCQAGQDAGDEVQVAGFAGVRVELGEDTGDVGALRNLLSAGGRS